MNLNNMRLAAKLWLAVGLIVLGLALVVGYTASRSASDRVESTAILEALNQKIKLASQWAGLTETNAARSQAVLLSSDPDGRNRPERCNSKHLGSNWRHSKKH